MADTTLDGYRFETGWAVLVQSLVRAPLAKVVLGLCQYSPQVPFLQDDQLIQALLPHRAHPALGDSIRIR